MALRPGFSTGLPFRGRLSREKGEVVVVTSGVFKKYVNFSRKMLKKHFMPNAK